MVRLRPTRLRDPMLSPSVVKLSDFGLLRGGCKIPASLAPRTSGNGSLVLHYTMPVVADGYFLVTSDQQPAFDPVGWAVEISQGEGETWQMAGASVYRFTYGGIGSFYPHLTYPVHEERRKAVVVLHQRSWLWALSSIFGNLLTSLSFLCAATAGFTGQEGLTTPVLVAMFGLRTATYATAAVGLQARGLWRDAAERWLLMPDVLLPAIGLSIDEGWIVSIFFFYSIFGVLTKTIYVFSFFEVDPLFYLSDSSLLIYAIAFAFASTLAIVRSRALASAHELVTADKVQYDKIWTDILANEAESKALTDVQREAQLLINAAANKSADEAASKLVRYDETSSQDKLWAEVRTGVYCIGTGNSAARQFLAGPLESLDQLFAQVRPLPDLLWVSK
jgi:hypothetical protein